jgi:hypothetical protein
MNTNEAKFLVSWNRSAVNRAHPTNTIKDHRIGISDIETWADFQTPVKPPHNERPELQVSLLRSIIHGIERNSCRPSLPRRLKNTAAFHETYPGSCLGIS